MANDLVTLVDSNVLLDVLTADPTWESWSHSALAAALDRGTVVINPIVYAEVSTGFHRIEELDVALPPSHFIRDPLHTARGSSPAKPFSPTAAVAV